MPTVMDTAKDCIRMARDDKEKDQEVHARKYKSETLAGRIDFSLRGKIDAQLLGPAIDDMHR